MKKQINGLHRGLTAGCALALTLALFGGGPVAARATSQPFSRIVVFGDSLSDTGNFYQLTGGLLPPAPYDNGRFSNGPLWIEYLARDLGMEVRPGDNYAVAGATTGHANSNDGLLGLKYPGLQDQIEAFLAARQAGGADREALYVIWAGANDFFVTLQSGGSPVALISAGVNNTVQALQSLWRAGARHILVLNVPDLGLTPFGLSSGSSGAITQLGAAYNQALETALEALGDAGVPTIRVDAFATLQTMAGFPAQFGFTNVTEPFLTTGGSPDRFLFWDAVHTTTRGHEILANQARNDLVDYYSPRKGKSEPPALIHSLNGLVGRRKGVR
jgi:outer membrane lipase/esterase